jgi:hypothetical protein
MIRGKAALMPRRSDGPCPPPRRKRTLVRGSVDPQRSTGDDDDAGCREVLCQVVGVAAGARRRP